jgi:glycosyltransferase involved in cell wall biosynthesis
MPEVTVILAVYNGMPYLPEAVDSILGQTFQDFTLLIIDDGSTDGTEDYLSRLDNPRVRVVHQANNGQGVARNVGLGICESEFVAIMDADDVSLPTRLEAQLRFFRDHEEIGMVGTQYEYLGNSGHSGFSPPMPCDHESIMANLLRGRLGLQNATLMCRTSILRQVGGYRIGGKGEDWDMFLRMGEATRLANLKEMLFLYRLHRSGENARILVQVRTQQAYSCECAKRRAKGQPEIPFDEFLAKQNTRPSWQHIADAMDTYAVGQYRLALEEILGHERRKGYARLMWAAISSPRWTSQRIFRKCRTKWKSWLI